MIGPLARRLRAPGSDRGSALVEFFWFAILLMVPLVYFVLTIGALQRASFAVTEAAQQATRAYATAGSDQTGEDRAALSAKLAMQDQGIRWKSHGRVVSCSHCTYAPGSTFTVRVATKVPLPLVPHWLCGHLCVAGITVSASHTSRLSCFGGTGPAASGTC